MSSETINKEKDVIKDNAHLYLQELSDRRAEVYLTEQFTKLIDEAKEHVESVEPADLYVIDEDILLLDVREPEEFGSGYINAHNHLTIPRGKLEFVAIKKIYEQYGLDVNIVTYCLKGPRGLLAAFQLKKMGFINVRNLNGGIQNWLSCGNTIKSYLGELTLASNLK